MRSGLDMVLYGINEIEEGFETRVGSIMATDIYEAARLFKNITERNKDSNYKIFKMDDVSGDYLMVGNSKNDLMLYNQLRWSLIDEGKI
jgi:hypothetical protein